MTDFGSTDLNSITSANVNARDAKGRTILMFAAAVGDDRAVMMLILKGADVVARDNDGYTAIHYAAAKKFDIDAPATHSPLPSV
jgi:ankyrin repeat protein